MADKISPKQVGEINIKMLLRLNTEKFFHFFFQISVFGVFKSVAEADIVFFNSDFSAEAEDIAKADAVNYLCRSAAVDLL